MFSAHVPLVFLNQHLKFLKDCQTIESILNYRKYTGTGRLGFRLRKKLPTQKGEGGGRITAEHLLSISGGTEVFWPET